MTEPFISDEARELVRRSRKLSDQRIGNAPGPVPEDFSPQVDVSTGGFGTPRTHTSLRLPQAIEFGRSLYFPGAQRPGERGPVERTFPFDPDNAESVRTALEASRLNPQLGRKPRPVDGFDPVREAKARGREDLLGFVLGAESPEEFDDILRRVDAEMNMEGTLHQSGLTGVAGSMIGGLSPLDIVTIPLLGGGSVRSVASGALRSGLLAATLYSPQELEILFTRQTRTSGEAAASLMAIGGLGAAISAVSPGRSAAVLGRTGERRFFDLQESPVGGVPRGAAATEVPEAAARAGTREADDAPDFAATGGEPESVAPRSAGAAAVGQGQTAWRSAAAQFEGEALAPTGTGIEKAFSEINPMLRLLNSPFLRARSVVEDLVPLGGMIKRKNLAGDATRISAETEIKMRYHTAMHTAIRTMDDGYLRYRGGVPDDSAVRTVYNIGLHQARDLLTRSRGGTPTFRSALEYREDIAHALRKNQVAAHLAPGVYRTEVELSAQHIRKVFDDLGKQANDLGLFERPLQNEIGHLTARIRELNLKVAASRKAGQIPDPAELARLDALKKEVQRLEAKVAQLRRNGPAAGNADGYVPRVWRHDRVLKRYDELVDIMTRHFRQSPEFKNLTNAELRVKMRDTIDLGILRERPYIEIDVAQKGKLAGDLGLMRERTLDIPDELVSDFLENDIEALVRYYVKSVGTDIELTRRFGDISMTSVTDEITEQAERLIQSAKTADERRALAKQRDKALRDVRGIRDRLRGTYGLPQDPYRPVSRFIRSAKIANVLIYGGGFAISAIPDMARAIMTEGLRNTYRFGLKTYFSGTRQHIRKMSAKEVRLAGTALDMTLGTRAMQFADVGDMFGRKYGAERLLNRAGSAYMLLNGLHLWNTVQKEFVGTVIGMRIAEASIQAASGNISKAQMLKLTRSGIDLDMAKRIAKEIKKFGQREGDAWMPNTQFWNDAEALRHYRAALNQDVDRTIITPDSGDRALWTSTEFGSMIAQFKSFGQSAFPKMMVSGLQERDAAFWQGLLTLVALGALTNEIKRAQFGDTRERSFSENLVDAVDRSGALGWMMDVNNGVEILSQYDVGLRPALGASRPYDPSREATLGTIFGPTGSTASNLGKVASDVLSGNVDHWTAQRMKRLVPGQNHPLVDFAL